MGEEPVRCGGQRLPARAMRCQGRSMGSPGAATPRARPRRGRPPTASAEISVTPSPIRTLSTTAPFDPSVRIRGEMPSRVEERLGRGPGARARLPQEPGGGRQLGPGQSGRDGSGPAFLIAARRGEERRNRAATTTRRFARVGQRCRAGRRPAADGQVDLVVGQQVGDPTAVADLERDRHLRDGAARNEASSGGARCSPAVVTAASRSRPRSGSASPRAAATASSSRASARPGPLGQRLAGRREPQPPPVPGHQRHAHLLADGGQRRRHRRLGHHQLIGRRPHRPGRRHGQEGPQLSQRQAGLFHKS